MTQYKLRLIQKLNHFKIPKSEYSFEGAINNNCLCVEKIEDCWQVCYINNEEKIVRGVFFKEDIACNFLFYLIMKKHVNIKKCWW